MAHIILISEVTIDVRREQPLSLANAAVEQMF
jgi:hypothetical protein